VLAAHRRTADAAGIEWKSAVYRKIGEEVIAGRGLTIERMVELARVSRASFYRFSEEAKPDRDIDLRDAIQRIALEWPSYGRPRITAELRRRGWTVNPKRVYRLLREDNPLCVRKRKFVVTTDSNHGRKVYLRQHQSLLASPGTDHMQGRLAAGAIKRAAQDLPIDGHNAPAMLGKLCHEALKRGAKLIRVEIAKQAAECVVAGHTVFQLEKAAQKRLFRFRKQRHVHRALATAPWPPHSTAHKAINRSS
jgi:hypothetical protein